MLSPETAAEPGRWRTDRAPYLREIMDAWTDDDVETIVFKKSSQVGATEVVGNCVGHVIDVDQGPILVIQPTLEMGGIWSKDRLAPMIRDTKCLRGKVRDKRSKDADNTILHKTFDGGILSIAGANASAGLRSRPVRFLVCDEVDAYPASAGAEGDPIALAEKRTATFWNRKKLYISTPTVKGQSRIDALFEGSDQQYYNVPCPECGEMQRLVWGQLKWLKTDDGAPIPDSARYECEFCAYLIGHEEKQEMLACGEWRPTSDFDGVRGFHLSELYSPWTTWAEMVADFDKKRRLPETLKTFINTSLGETWEQESEKFDPEDLAARAEAYEIAPEGVLVLTAGVDVQDNRLEAELLGWGDLYESWSLEVKIFYGDPTIPWRSEHSVWKELDAWLNKRFPTEAGPDLPISACCIDSGHHTDDVYRFTKPRWARRVYAVKGQGGGTLGTPIVGRVSRSNKLKAPFFLANVDQAKDRLFSWLAVENFGPGYCHFPMYDAEYFAQLASEERIERISHGQRVRAYKQKRARNEALDLRVYNIVAAEILDPNFDALEAMMQRRRSEKKPEPKQESAAKATVMHNVPRRPSGWMAKRTRR